MRSASTSSPLLIFGVTILVLNKILLGDLGRFVTHGGKSFRTSAKSSKLGAIALVLYGIAATLLPIIGLVLVALSPFWSGQLHPSQFTLNAEGIASRRGTNWHPYAVDRIIRRAS